MSESRFYGSSFGGVRLWISRLETDKSRTKVIHDPANGDDHVVQDRGKVVLRATATLLFDYMRGDDKTPIERLNEFKALVDSPDSHVLTHPVEGSFSASVESFRYTVDDSGQITAECAFIADGAVSDAVPSGRASAPASGMGAVDAAASAYETEFMELGLDDGGLGAASKNAIDAWFSGNQVSARQVAVDTGGLTKKLGTMAAGLSGDIEKWQSYKSTINLIESVYFAGKAALSGNLTTFIVKVATGTPLRALLASEYGADQVDLRYQQVLDLNDLAAPALVEAGSELRLPQLTPRGRNG